MEQENLVVKDSLTTKIIYKNNIINTQKIRLVIGSPFSSIEIFICKSFAQRIFCSIFAKTFKRCGCF